ncbi:hypothetical protein BKA66DRAFT_235531 [Pyrenochaeta sp. MPI-SDFR-AT-0127]|nr:hypothetical protein BKA66DRAFT_235531 [Pyrenochaeta sp. MPI-SDFR-AT-0127]
MPKLYYFQAPTFTINPESDIAPKLGSIFSSLDRLTGPLNQFENVYIPTNLTNQSASADFSETVEKGLEGAVGVNANVAQGMAGSADVVYAFARDKKNTYRCELLETVEFEPTKEFIADSITASQRVQNTLDNALPGMKRVYMVTGLKLATGFSTSTSKETQHGPMLKVGVDATAFGIPVEAGPEVELATTDGRTVSQGRSVNKIVFAYRVVRIRLRRDGEAKWKYKSGGKYSAQEEDSDDEEVPWDIEPLDEGDVVKDFPDAIIVKVEAEETQEPARLQE